MIPGKWHEEAPSNIALIKYMGKVESVGTNQPTNSSLSYTLPHLKSVVELEQLGAIATADRWEPLGSHHGKALPATHLSERGIERFLAHLGRIKQVYGYRGHFMVRSANDFPSDCGLASSASSFAALTKVAIKAICQLTGKPLPTIGEAAELSRKGSGSSCRSFFSPWSIWTPDRVSEVPELAKHGDLIHQVVVVSGEVKAVSSSEAHKRVASSLLFAGRIERAEMRLADLIDALRRDAWVEAFEICWAELWDMHALFETSRPSFGYMTPGSIEVMRFVREKIWHKEGIGPLVTMDAGPNVHLLYRPEHASLADKVRTAFGQTYTVFQSESGSSKGVGR